MRHRYHPDAVKTVEASPYVVKTIPPQPSLVVEVGCGKGQFILQQALKHPEVYFVGIEQSAQALYRAVLKAEAVAPTNLSFIWGPIDEVLPTLPAPIHTLYILFSDPWPKARHEKRRLTTLKRLQEYAEHGVQQIIFKTDNHELYTYSLETFQASSFNIITSGLAPWIPLETTEFEDKYRQLNQPIYQIEAKR